MRAIIISDLHLGDPACGLVAAPSPGSPYVLGPAFLSLRAQIGTGCDYLIIVGDLFDFSIAGWAGAYEAARVFFCAIAAHQLTRQVIYLPGNHDFSFLHVLLHEINVINQIKAGQPPKKRWSIPAVLDDHESCTARGVLQLPMVSGEPGSYGGLFLDALAGTHADGKPNLTFNVAYPNLYLTTANAEHILITHGQYLQDYWAFMAEFAKEITGDDLKLAGGTVPSIEDLVAINFPLNELASSGIGQAGPLTVVAQQVESEVKAGNFQRVERYVRKLERWIDDKATFSAWRFIKEPASDAALKIAANKVLEGLKQIDAARYDKEFATKEAVQRRFLRYYRASLMEAHELRSEHGVDVGVPTRFLFGHTHEPIPWGDPKAPGVYVVDTAQRVTLHNMGGWLWRHGVEPGSTPIGAEVFVYETDTGMMSVTV